MIERQYEYEAMARCEEDLWWYKCLHELTLNKIEQHFGKKAAILDAGCGTGGLLHFLQKNGYENITGFDVSPDAVRFAKSKYQLNVSHLNLLDSANAYAANSFDVIVSHDVLYFFETKEQLALANLLALLKPGGMLLMNLPCGAAFKGTHDVAVGIKTRYTKQRIQKIVEGENLNITEMKRWPFLLSPVIFSVRLLQRIKMMLIKPKQYKSDVNIPPALLNNFFYKLTTFENKALNVKPWGSSIFITMCKN